jgi:hypothetical protein
VFSQAAAVAHIKRVGQQLDEAFRTTQQARRMQQDASQLPQPIPQQQTQTPGVLPTPPATVVSSSQPGSSTPKSTQGTVREHGCVLTELLLCPCCTEAPRYVYDRQHKQFKLCGTGSCACGAVNNDKTMNQ